MRNLVVPKQNKARHEEKVCKLINKYFDMLLVHSDPSFIRLEKTFYRVNNLNCQVHYTGYVAQKVPWIDCETTTKIKGFLSLILVSVGGERFGHELLEYVVKTAPILK